GKAPHSTAGARPVRGPPTRATSAGSASWPASTSVRRARSVCAPRADGRRPRTRVTAGRSRCGRAAPPAVSRAPARRVRLAKPRRQRLLELLATFRGDNAHLHAAAVDNADRRQLPDAEVLDQPRVPLGADTHEPERLVIVAPLHHLRENRLDPPTRARGLAVEEDEARLLDRAFVERYSDGARHEANSDRIADPSNLRLLGGHDDDHSLELV